MGTEEKGSLFKHILHGYRPQNANKLHAEQLTFGQKLADTVASGMGSWPFIIWQSVIVIAWIIANILLLMHPYDPYPFILLNLLFSTQAAYAAPVIMMSQNRQAAKDRIMVENDYHTDVANREHIEQMISHLEAQDAELLKQTNYLIELIEHAKGKPPQ